MPGRLLSRLIRRDGPEAALMELIHGAKVGRRNLMGGPQRAVIFCGFLVVPYQHSLSLGRMVVSADRIR